MQFDFKKYDEKTVNKMLNRKSFGERLSFWIFFLIIIISILM